jgi:DNA-binding IclR family transcriptional regulator
MLKAKGALDDASVRGVAKLIGARKSTAHNAIAALIAAGVVARVGGELVLAAAA